MSHEPCSHCGRPALEVRVVPLEVEHAGKTVTVDDVRTVCADCGGFSYRGEQISAHELAVAAAIRRIDGLLSADELRNVRLKYRLKQTDMEQMLSTGPKTWTRWERGKVPQSKSTDKLIRAIADDPDLARHLLRQTGIVNAEAEAAFAQYDDDMRRFAKLAMKRVAGEGASPDLLRFAETVADNAVETMRDVRRKAASRVEAA